MKKIFYLLFAFVTCFSCIAQNQMSLETKPIITDNPKLVVGIVVDQMRYDYLTRFYSKYGEGGFKRIINNGFNCKNNHFNFIPTKTGPGHASIYTGSTPKYHGVIGNDWFDKDLGRNVNCVEDDSVMPVGTQSNDGKKSPHRMIATTLADENRLFNQMRAKTIGVSLKHRGAILPAGHTANAAYWFDYEHNGDGDWITSTFYLNELPQWVKNFNSSNICESYFKEWNTLYDIATYTESGSDSNNFEGTFTGKELPTFPYNLNQLKDENGKYNVIAESAFGNSLVTDFALAAIDGEALGKDNITDILTISYSSTDKVGHKFGVNSKEIEDTYLRLDIDIERMLIALDEKIGIGDYTVFLTADHGAPETPNYLKSVKIPAGLFDENKMKNILNEILEIKYGISDLILSRINNQIFFDHIKISQNKLDLEDLKSEVALELLKFELIDKVYVTSEINQFEYNNGYLESMLSKGHNQKRSGEVLYVFNPSVFKDSEWNRTGTDHHTGLSYDTHVPLLFFGKGIKQGQTFQRTEITDVAPTISALLGISFPNACIGNPLEFVLE